MEENNIKPFAISQKALLTIYAIVPAILILVILDGLFFNHLLREHMSLDIMTTALYLLFLELPHVIASFISYADKEYAAFYKKRIFFHLPILLLALTALLFIHPGTVFLIYLVYTMYHALKQQTGIAGMLAKSGGTIHILWSYACIAVAIFGNIYIFSPQLLSLVPVSGSLLFLLVVAALITVTLVYIHIRTMERIGLAYIIANTYMLVVSFVCGILGYYFFAVLAVRFVHDATAFFFYTVHDSNRNAQEAKNIFYKILKPTRVPLLFITPVLGISVAYLLQHYGGISQTLSIGLILIGVTHYYIEGFMWKRESIHRKQLRFVD